MAVVIGEIIGWEILVPLALIAILFGGSKLPGLARSLGQAQGEFRKGLQGETDDAGAVTKPDAGPDAERTEGS
jgi:sec-independent protein translocase protein TatA